jgi:hypothetical protein
MKIKRLQPSIAPRQMARLTQAKERRGVRGEWRIPPGFILTCSASASRWLAGAKVTAFVAPARHATKGRKGSSSFLKKRTKKLLLL